MCAVNLNSEMWDTVNNSTIQESYINNVMHFIIYHFFKEINTLSHKIAAQSSLVYGLRMCNDVT